MDKQLFVLIDGSSYLFRAFYALPLLTNSKGLHTNATYGFNNMLQKLLKQYPKAQVVTIFDSKEKNFRHALYSEYKANRSVMPQELAEQIPYIHRLIQALGLPLLIEDGVEADDVIASIAIWAVQQDYEVLIVTQDKDFAQIVSPHIKLYNSMHDEIMDEAKVISKFGVSSKQIIDYLTLIGDSVDNIPGVHKVGPKTAQKLITEYGSLEAIIANNHLIKGVVGENIRAVSDKLPLFKQLITIDCNIAIPNELEFYKRTANDREQLISLYSELEFATQLKQLEHHEQAAQVLDNTRYQLVLINKDNPIPEFAANKIIITNDSKYLFKNSTLKLEQIEDVLLRNYLLNSTLKPSCTNIEELQQLWFKSINLNDFPKLQTVYQEMELPLAKVLAKMESYGILLDSEKLKLLSSTMAEKIASLEQQIFSISGREFNINSPKQLQEILFTELGLPVVELTPQRTPSTKESVLQELAEKYPLPQLILEYRSLSKLKSTYADTLPLAVNPNTNRIHTTYHQTVTSTGRLSSSDPNLQNIPIKTALGREIRAGFIAAPGAKLVALDYSQIELRIMAHLSQDKHLLEAFKNNKDIHIATASKMFGLPEEAIDKELRRRAKAINFGLMYGMSSFGLSKQLNVLPQVAEELINQYFTNFPQVKEFMDLTCKLAAQNGYVETIYGRRLYLPDISAKNIHLRKAAERAAINAPMQGSNADIIKLAMIAIDKYLASHNFASKMLLQVHDELVFEVPDDEINIVVPQLQKIMEHNTQLSVPLTIEVGVGVNWDLAHG